MFLHRIVSRNLSNAQEALKKLQRTMPSDYEAAINALNNLQSNSQYIRIFGAQSQNNNTQQTANTLHQVEKYILRSGLTLDKLDTLPVIHVTGTKGKGTTCAFCESILRYHGYKTGFFSSPHLLQVRERIRIDGKPIEKDVFAKYFWKLYNTLDHKKSNPTDMPLYFRFLAILAFHIFIEYRVDVAIIEVGIGGQYDCTNILRKVPVVGITSLGIDHTSLLGSSLESIAWHKAGIMKKGCKAFTVSQPNNAMKVLEERSKELPCDLKVIDTHLDLPFQNKIPMQIMESNASLAMALSEAWISQDTTNNNNSKKLYSPELARKALENCIWPGRYEVIKQKNVSYYLDGAHTIESIKVCVNWFKHISDTNTRKVLMFNVTGDRNSENLLEQFLSCHFEIVIFVPNVATRSSDQATADTTNIKSTVDKQLARCQEHRRLWLSMVQDYADENTNVVKVLPSVLDGIRLLDDGNPYDVLVTGSIHLIGAVLSILDPSLRGTL